MYEPSVQLPPLLEDRMSHWTGKRVVVLGAGRQGVALARWLSRRGANVIISDQKEASQLGKARATLEGVSVEWALGGHPLTLLDECDLVCLSGGVPSTLPLVREAVRRGIRLSNDAQLFLESAPCTTVGITGSAGKTTTTTLVGLMAKKSLGDLGPPSAPLPRAGPLISPEGSADRRVHVGGNIGEPLLNHLDEMRHEDLAVMELSSFQLEHMSLSPQIAAVLNITPNHLDRHGSMEAYAAAKARILEFQTAGDTAVLNRDDAGAWRMSQLCRGKLMAFSLSPLSQGLNGAYLEDGLLSLRIGQAYVPLLPRDRLKLRGEHNVANALAAFAIGHAAGLAFDAMLEAAESFGGVPHRLELVRELHGVRWFNDSIATAPERTMAAIRSFDEPIVLLLGGRDKDLPWEPLAALVEQRVDHVVIFGEAAAKIHEALRIRQADRGNTVHSDTRPRTVDVCGTLENAVEEAARIATSGDVVLFSPGGTSFDAFADFEERGERFRQCVSALS